MPRVAIFTPYLPAPAFSGGRIRIHRLSTALAGAAELELFAQASPAETRAARGAAELSIYSRVHTAARLFPAWPASELPARVRRGSPRRLLRAFLAAHRAAPFDVVVVEHVHAARWAPELGLPWVLDEHNVESRYVAARDGAAGAEEVRRLERWQRAMWRRANRVVSVTADDAAEIEAAGSAPPVLIPNGVDADAVGFVPPSARSGADVLFVGLLDHPPNVRAAEWLVREVLPLVRRRVPSARAVLCGANPSRAVRALASGSVVVTGQVPSVMPHLAAARAYACPLREGAGSSLKVLEALASGVPLVATQTAARGVRLEDGVHFRRAEDVREFVEHLVAVLQGTASDEMARRGRALAEGYDWAALGRRFSEVVIEVLARSGAPPAGSHSRRRLE